MVREALTALALSLCFQHSRRAYLSWCGCAYGVLLFVIAITREECAAQVMAFGYRLRARWIMSDAVERLKWLCSPDAERLSDGERINQFVKAGLEAVGELDALLTAAKSLLAHQCDPALFNSKGEFLDPDLQTLYRTIKHERRASRIAVK